MRAARRWSASGAGGAGAAAAAAAARRWLRFWTATSEASHAAFMPLDLRSIALGVVELALTPRDQSKAAWPADLPATVEALAAAFDAFVAGLASSPALTGAASAAAKVKVVADAVWSKLQKGYSKDLQHAQVGRRCTFCRCVWHVERVAGASLVNKRPSGRMMLAQNWQDMRGTHCKSMLPRALFAARVQLCRRAQWRRGGREEAAGLCRRGDHRVQVPAG